MAAVRNDRPGTAVNAAGTAVATAEEVFEVTTDGLVGAFNWNPCKLCDGASSSPDGTTETWHVGPETSGVESKTVQFVGPAGSWAWSWSGVMSTHFLAFGDPVIAAYAPIGDDWPMFRPSY
jgi:hypothetical protein